MDEVYCIDTSGWTGLKRGYPLKNFPSLWANLEHLISGRRITSPYEVYQELEEQEDELFKKVQKRKQIFQKIDEEHLALVTDILKVFPKLANPLKPGPVADPFVIALAIVTNRNLAIFGGQCIVVSGETPGGGKKAKIPDVCSSYYIKHFSVINFISNEGWIF